MTYRTGADQLIILAESEPIFHLPAGQTGLDDLADRPIGIIGDDNVLAEPLLFLANLMTSLRELIVSPSGPTDVF